MKRQSDGVETLVYAYGCGEPTAGVDAVMAEDARMRALWDRLVGIDREYERRVLASACADDEKLAAIVADLRQLVHDRARHLAALADRLHSITGAEAPTSVGGS